MQIKKVEALIHQVSIEPALIQQAHGPLQVFQFTVVPTDGRGNHRKPHRYILTAEHLLHLLETVEVAVQAAGLKAQTPPSAPGPLQ